MQHLQEKGRKHEKTITHLDNLVDFNLLGKTDIRMQVDYAYAQSIRRHNEKVNQNRHILRRLIMCVKFCGAFKLALRGHDETESSSNRGVYLGLVNFTAKLDSVLARHLQEAVVFTSTSNTIQNELFDSMLQVIRDEIAEQI